MQLERYVLRTPLIPYVTDGPELAGRIYLKAENLQPFGSFKIRGIASAVRQADPQQLRRGLHAASAGNMAQAVAFAARQLGCPCRIYVPQTAPGVKKAAIRQLGAQLIEIPFETAWRSVQGEVTLETDGVFVHPFRTETLFDGYAAIVTEIMRDLPDVDALVVPFGTGGLAIGLSRALASLNRKVALYTVEPQTAAPMHASFLAAMPTPVQREHSFVDAIGVPAVNPLVFTSLIPVIAGAEHVAIDDAERAVATLYRRHRLVVEGAGGCALAAAEQLARERSHQRIVAILSGGNIGERVLQEILERRAA